MAEGDTGLCWAWEDRTYTCEGVRSGPSRKGAEHDPGCYGLCGPTSRGADVDKGGSEYGGWRGISEVSLGLMLQKEEGRFLIPGVFACSILMSPELGGLML